MSNRRSFIKKLALAGASLGLPLPSSAGIESVFEKDDFSFIHLTDMHVKRKRKGHEGYQACIDAVNKFDKKSDFVLMGGDMAFDGNYTAKEEFIDQIDLYKNISDQLKMPYYNLIGNHDVLGWSKQRKVSVDDPDIGKKLIMDKLKMPASYYSFNHKGWHFVMMDSIHPIQADHGPSYKAGFGEEQLEWLRFDLGKNHNMPTVIVSHIAAFCHVTQMNGDSKGNSLGSMVVDDTVKFRQIIERHNVKAVLQGHSHVPEDYFYNGVWYITSQAVSAAWWGGNWKGYLPGYTILYTSDENLRWERRIFEWQHFLEPEDTLERQRIAEREDFEKKQKELLNEEIQSGSKK
ncbi:MAG TPA: metallophosphoesterase [Cyclobacteriaceae bacterium]|nr:metallophosphoesterase [Cyclobacteriaceae bacterium]